MIERIALMTPNTTLPFLRIIVDTNPTIRISAGE